MPPTSISPCTKAGNTRLQLKHDDCDGIAFADAELVEDFLDMGFFRSKAKVKQAGNSLVGKATGHEPRDFVLSNGKGPALADPRYWSRLDH